MLIMAVDGLAVHVLVVHGSLHPLCSVSKSALYSLWSLKKWSSISLTLLFNFSRKKDHLHTGNRSKTGSDPCPKSSKNGVWQQVLLLLRIHEARTTQPHYLKETTPPTWSKDSTTTGFRLGFRLGFRSGFRLGFCLGVGFV